MSGGRIRTIKPEILDDQEVAQLSDAAWRLWVSLWVCADDYGNVRGGSRWLAANIWQDTSRDVEPLITELVAARRVTTYDVHGDRYLSIRNWDRHQRITNRGKRRVPDPNDPDSFGAVSPRTSANLGNPTTGAASLRRSQLAHARVSDPDPDPDPEREAAATQLPARARSAPPADAGSLKGSQAKEKKERTRKIQKPERTPPPPSSLASEALDAWCRSAGVPTTAENAEILTWLDYHRARGAHSSDWAASWRVWERRGAQHTSELQRRAEAATAREQTRAERGAVTYPNGPPSEFFAAERAAAADPEVAQEAIRKALEKLGSFGP